MIASAHQIVSGCKHAKCMEGVGYATKMARSSCYNQSCLFAVTVNHLSMFSLQMLARNQPTERIKEPDESKIIICIQHRKAKLQNNTETEGIFCDDTAHIPDQTWLWWAVRLWINCDNTAKDMTIRACSFSATFLFSKYLKT